MLQSHSKSPRKSRGMQSTDYIELVRVGELRLNRYSNFDSGDNRVWPLLDFYSCYWLGVRLTQHQWADYLGRPMHQRYEEAGTNRPKCPIFPSSNARSIVYNLI